MTAFCGTVTGYISNAAKLHTKYVHQPTRNLSNQILGTLRLTGWMADGHEHDRPTDKLDNNRYAVVARSSGPPRHGCSMNCCAIIMLWVNSIPMSKIKVNYNVMVCLLIQLLDATDRWIVVGFTGQTLA